MIPRRNRVDLYTPAETPIFDAIDAVESLGADTRLTDAVILLGDAKSKVADYIEEQLAACTPPPPGYSENAEDVATKSAGKMPESKNEQSR